MPIVIDSRETAASKKLIQLQDEFFGLYCFKSSKYFGSHTTDTDQAG